MPRPFGQMYAIEPNPVGSTLADWLYSGRDFANKAEIPVLGGLGDILFGEAPEVIEDWAYGFPPYSGSGQTTQLDPRMVDVAGLPLPYAGSYYGAKGLYHGAKKLDDVLGRISPTPDDYGFAKADDIVSQVRNTPRHAPLDDTTTFAGLPEQPINEGRRQFLKDMGLAIAGTVAATKAPMFAESVLKGVGSDAGRVAATATMKGLIPASSINTDILGMLIRYPEILNYVKKKGYKGINPEYMDETEFNNLMKAVDNPKLLKYSEPDFDVYDDFLNYKKSYALGNDIDKYEIGDWLDMHPGVNPITLLNKLSKGKISKFEKDSIKKYRDDLWAQDEIGVAINRAEVYSDSAYYDDFLDDEGWEEAFKKGVYK